VSLVDERGHLDTVDDHPAMDASIATSATMRG
jgi:hypothetical protein